MIIYSNDDKLINNQEYQSFLENNPGRGTLKIRASSINEALPVENVRIIVQKNIGQNTIIFFDGKTDNSGMVNNIKLPTPSKISNNEEAPNFATYDIIATYKPDNFNKTFSISICCSSTLIQYINIIPNINLESDFLNGD